MNFQPDDIYRYCEIGSVKSRYDASTIVCSATTIDRERDHYDTALWLIHPHDGSKPVRIVEAAVKPTSPVMAPCGKAIALLMQTDDGVQQAQRLALDDIAAGFCAFPACGHKLKSLLEWSSARNALLATAETIWTERDAHMLGNSEADPKVVDFLPYKSDGRGVLIGKRTHLFALDVDGDEWRPLTTGDFDVSSAEWSPDGTILAFIRSCDGRQRHCSELWLADADGSNARLCTDSFAHARGLAWSPNGRTLAVGVTRMEGDSRVELCLVDTLSATTVFPDDALELEGSSFAWHPDGERLATLCAHEGLFQMAIVKITTGVAARIGPRLGHVAAFAQFKDGLAYIAESVRTAAEVLVVPWSGDGAKRRSKFNSIWFRERARPRAIKRRFSVPDGEGGVQRADAWLLLPPDRTGPFPLLVDMHGGPQSIALIDFAAHAYWYALVAQGWAVLAPNCIGSSSYGADYARRLRGCWGELDLPQHLAIVSQLQREGLADERVACAGKSYGGFLAAWALGQTDLFRAAAIAAPVADIGSHAGTSDSGYYVTPYAMKGDIDEISERYRRLSPIGLGARTHTAALILQGSDDERCPLGQAEQLFARLIRRGDAPTRLVVYPKGSHALSSKGKPSHRLDFHSRLVAWLIEHTSTPTPHRTTVAAMDTSHAPSADIIC